jgi:large subunit ribosomal protein L25
MFTVQVEKRELHSKGKQLRRQGIIPAVLYGKHLEESVHLKMSQQEAEQLLKSSAISSKLELKIGKEKHMAMLKEATYTPKRTVEHLCFQALKADEIVNSITHVILIGKEKVDGLVLQTLDEISYRALPSNMVERIEVNVENLTVGENIKVSDLPFSRNEDVEILTPLDSVVVTVSARIEHVVETETAEEGAEGEEVSADNNEA